MRTDDLSHNFNSLESFVLRRAFWIFVLFNILLFAALPAAQSERPYVRPNLAPAIVVIALVSCCGSACWSFISARFAGRNSGPRSFQERCFLPFSALSFLLPPSH